MRPPIEEMSDEESGDIPFNNAKDATEDKAEQAQQEEGGEEDDEDEEGVYVVEKVNKHKFEPDGSLQLQVKWNGWEDPKDLTWEPEENLKEGANDVLEEYYKKLGGRPKKPAPKPGPKPGRKRKSTADSKSVTSSAASSTEPKRRRKSAKAEETESDSLVYDENWVPKSNNWEEELAQVDTIIRDSDNGGLYAFLLRNNGRRSRVSIESCYEKCPDKMLKFYENHLVFKES